MAAQSLPAESGADDAGPPNLLYLIGRIDRLVRRAIDDVVRDYGLSAGQYATLSVLARRNGLSNAQLARRALVSPQSMNEVLLALEKQALVRRRPHPQHGRIRPVQLSAKGRRLLAACDERVRAVERTMVRDLSGADQDTLRHSLVTCAKALQSAPPER